MAHAVAQFNVNWIYTLPGSLAITALLAWPVSKQGSPPWHERILFIFLSMLGVALFNWSFGQHAGGLNDNLNSLNVGGPFASLVAAGFLIWLWFDKIVGIISELLLGCFDNSDKLEMDPETRQIHKAIRFYRNGSHQRALDVCSEIVESNSHYTIAALTLAEWIENSDSIKIVKYPRSNLTFRGQYAHLNLNMLLAF